MKIIIYYFIFLMLVSTGYCQQENSQKDLQITYIANEGFLLTSDNKKILIDALFKSKNYTSPSDSLVTKFMSNTHPFDNINYYLITHSHQDHFNEKMTQEFLSKNTKTKFISTSESCDKLNDLGFNSPQLICYDLEYGEVKEIKDEQISITTFRLKHLGDPEIKNLSFIIQINDYSIMHVGDASILQNEDYINKINWDNYKIDALFVGYMDVNEYVLEILKNTIKPKNIIMMHIHEEDIQEAKDRNEKYSANAIIFEKELETKIFNNK